MALPDLPPTCPDISTGWVRSPEDRKTKPLSVSLWIAQGVPEPEVELGLWGPGEAHVCSEVQSQGPMAGWVSDTCSTIPGHYMQMLMRLATGARGSENRTATTNWDMCPHNVWPRETSS